MFWKTNEHEQVCKKCWKNTVQHQSSLFLNFTQIASVISNVFLKPIRKELERMTVPRSLYKE